YVDGKIRFQGEDFKVTLAGDYSQNDDANGNGWQNENPAKSFFTYRFLMGASGFTAPGSATGQLLFGALGDTALAALPAAYVNPQQGKFDTVGSIEHHALQKDYGASATADIDLPLFTLTSITAFRWNQSQFRGDVGVGNVPIAGFETNFRRRFIYQEVRMVSTGDGPFTWLAGATYFHEKIQNSLASVVLGLTFPPTIATTKTDAYSGYAQGEYELTDKLKAIASVRYITETKSALYPAQVVTIFNFAPGTPVPGRPQGLVPGQAVPKATGSTGVDKFLPSFTLSYGLDGGGNAYARWARGLKTGGANPLVHPAQTLGTINAFKPEKVDTYEIGLKTNLFDRKVQLNTAIFYNDYRNLQITRTGYTGLAFVLINAGKAETYGAEAALNWQVSPVFSLAANIGYLHARYIDFKSPGIPQLQVAPFDLSGNTMVQSPEWQGGLTANLDMPITDQYNLSGTLLYSYISKYFTSDENSASVSQDGFSLVNLRLGVRTEDNKYGVYLSVKNVFDKRYALFGSFSGTSEYTIPGAPRIIGAQVEVKF
ncbi:MAG: TonB-dependent receptor, partial [Alphaproteobacteria bacterium]